MDHCRRLSISEYRYREFKPKYWRQPPERWRTGGQEGPAVPRRTRNGSSSSSSPFFLRLVARCTLRMPDRIIDRWMDRVGKGKRARHTERACRRPLVPRLAALFYGCSFSLPPRVFAPLPLPSLSTFSHLLMPPLSPSLSVSLSFAFCLSVPPPPRFSLFN